MNDCRVDSCNKEGKHKVIIIEKECIFCDDHYLVLQRLLKILSNDMV